MRLDEIPAPHRGAEQILVRVHACGLTVVSADHVAGKFLVVIDAQGLSFQFGLTAGQARDGQIDDTLLDPLGPSKHRAGAQRL